MSKIRVALTDLCNDNESVRSWFDDLYINKVYANAQSFKWREFCSLVANEMGGKPVKNFNRVIVDIDEQQLTFFLLSLK